MLLWSFWVIIVCLSQRELVLCCAIQEIGVWIFTWSPPPLNHIEKMVESDAPKWRSKAGVACHSPLKKRDHTKLDMSKFQENDTIIAL